MNIGKNERVGYALHALIIVQALRGLNEFPENSQARIDTRNAPNSHTQILGSGRTETLTSSVPRSTVNTTASPGTATVSSRCRSSTPLMGLIPKRKITSRSRSPAVCAGELGSTEITIAPVFADNE